MRTTRGVLTVLAVLAGLIAALVCSPAALAKPTTPAKLTKTKTQTAVAPSQTGATVTATLSYTPKSYYDSSIRLTITRGGQQVYSAPLAAKQCGVYCAVGYGRAVHAVDVQGDGEPEVFVDLYTGGAHCCSLTQFFTYDPGTQTYRSDQVDWGDPGYRLVRVGHQYLFETGNDAFAYEFTDYAASGLPLELFSFNGEKLVDITRRFPRLITRDAAVWLKAFTSQASSKWSDTVGVIAAWAADEDELGNSARVAAYLKAQAAAGHLNSAEPGVPEGTVFIRALQRFLKRYGYVT